MLASLVPLMLGWALIGGFWDGGLYVAWGKRWRGCFFLERVVGLVFERRDLLCFYFLVRRLIRV